MYKCAASIDTLGDFDIHISRELTRGGPLGLEVELHIFCNNTLLQRLYMVEFYLLGYKAMLSGESQSTFGGICRLHFQGIRVSQARDQHEAGSRHSSPFSDPEEFRNGVTKPVFLLSTFPALQISSS
jgi:hypothetical protein